jgi:KaiC/GvpD/RAD55 family RecA-like ATPase
MAESPTPSDVADRLRALPAGSGVAFKLGGAEYAENYLAALAAVLRDFASEVDGFVIYVSMTNPSALVNSLLGSLDIPVDRVFFVDAISHVMMSHTSRLPNASYVESPTMLENIMLRVEYYLRRARSPRKIVVLDSVNSFAIHNDPSILAEFFHIMVNNLKSRGITTVILAVTEDTSPELENILSLVCDDTIRLGGPAPAGAART